MALTIPKSHGSLSWHWTRDVGNDRGVRSDWWNFQRPPLGDSWALTSSNVFGLGFTMVYTTTTATNRKLKRLWGFRS